MAVIQYLANLIEKMEPFSHSSAPCFTVPYRLCTGGDLAQDAPEDCLRRYSIVLSGIEQGDCGLMERSRHLKALVCIESACPLSLPGLWSDLYFEEECLRLLETLCGQDHSQAGLLSAQHIASSQIRAGNTIVLFRHEFELHYLNETGEK